MLAIPLNVPESMFLRMNIVYHAIQVICNRGYNIGRQVFSFINSFMKCDFLYAEALEYNAQYGMTRL